MVCAWWMGSKVHLVCLGILMVNINLTLAFTHFLIKSLAWLLFCYTQGKSFLKNIAQNNETLSIDFSSKFLPFKFNSDLTWIFALFSYNNSINNHSKYTFFDSFPFRNDDFSIRFILISSTTKANTAFFYTFSFSYVYR